MRVSTSRVEKHPRESLALGRVDQHLVKAHVQVGDGGPSVAAHRGLHALHQLAKTRHGVGGSALEEALHGRPFDRAARKVDVCDVVLIQDRHEDTAMRLAA
jgi:hypothetical protein